MKARVTTEFPGRPDSEALSRTVEVGEIIEGDLAAVAVREGWAEEIAGSAPAEVNPLDDMTTAQLKAYAEEHKIALGDATKKADIRAAIDLALEAKK